MNSNLATYKKILQTSCACVLYTMVLAPLQANAKGPTIERRALSQSNTATQNAKETASTSTEWQLYQKILELDEEITQLRDKVERMESAVDTAKKEQTNFQDSIKQRLNNQEDAIIEVVDKLEGNTSETTDEENTDSQNSKSTQAKTNSTNTQKKTASQTGSSIVKGAGNIAGKIKSGAGKLPTKIANTASKAATNKTQTTEQPKVSYEDTAKKVYLSAYNDFKQKGKMAGVASMKKFIQNYGDSKLVPSAHFWIGEFYLSGAKPDFQSAKQSFLTVANSFPNSQKTPKSLYRLGYIAKINNENNRAKNFMREILSKHPNSREAGLAKAFLQRYGGK